MPLTSPLQPLLMFVIATAALTACGGDQCNDAPLSGATVACADLDGSWIVLPNEKGDHCGAELFSNAVMKISSNGSELRGSVAGNRLLGVNHVSGAFELDSTDGNFSLSGQALKTRPPQLRGSVVFGGAGQTCTALWDFTAYRE